MTLLAVNSPPANISAAPLEAFKEAMQDNGEMTVDMMNIEEGDVASILSLKVKEVFFVILCI